MRRWWLLLLLALSIGLNVGLLVTVVVDAEEPRPDPVPFGSEATDGAERRAAPEARRGEERPSPRALERFGTRLGLEGAARDEFAARHREFFETVRRKRRELGVLRRRLRRELVATEPDRDRIERLVEESGRVRAEMELAFADHVIASRRLLEGEAERRYLGFISRLAGSGPEPRPRTGRRGPDR